MEQNSVEQNGANQNSRSQIQPKHLLITFLIALILGGVGTYIVVNQNWMGEVERQRAANAEQSLKLQQNYDALKTENEKLIDRAQKLIDGIKKSTQLTDVTSISNLTIIERTQRVIEVLKQVRDILSKLVEE